jgi:hypothetical protein
MLAVVLNKRVRPPPGYMADPVDDELDVRISIRKRKVNEDEDEWTDEANSHDDDDDDDGGDAADEQEAAAERKRKRAKRARKNKEAPLDAIRDLFYMMCGYLDPASLLALSRCKQAWTLNVLNRDKVRLWEPAARSLLAQYDMEVDVPSRNYKATVALLSDRGCETCGKARIRKVVFEFGWRLCKACTHAATISDYRLTNEYPDVPHETMRHMLTDLPCTSADLWSRWYGDYTLNFYAVRMCNTWLTLRGFPTLASQQRVQLERARVAREVARIQSLARAKQQRRDKVQRVKRHAQLRQQVIDVAPECTDDCAWEQTLRMLDEPTRRFWQEPHAVTEADRERMTIVTSSIIVAAYRAVIARWDAHKQREQHGQAQRTKNEVKRLSKQQACAQ